MITTPVERRFTLPYDRIADFLPVGRMLGTEVWIRITTPVKPKAGTKVGIKLDISELGRPIEMVAEVQAEEQTGFRCKVIEAALADEIVLLTILGGDVKALMKARMLPGGGPSPVAPVPPMGSAATPVAPTVPRMPVAPQKTQKLHRVPALAAKPHQGDDFSDLLVRDTVQIVSDRVLGIDLGTSNSCVALSERGALTIFSDHEGRETVPSVVAYGDHGRMIVGHEANEQMAENPERTIFGSKRLIGRAYASDAVQQIIAKVPYKIVPDASNAAAIEIDGSPVSMAEIGSHILRHLKQIAERTAGQELQRAVVTVPAYYNDNQRHAVKHAGSLAGLHVERIIDEPTAAAIAFGIGEAGRDRKILIYDLGGGTFDVSVMHIQGNTFFKTLATAGDNFLGGADIDARIVDYVIETYEEGFGHHIWSTHPGIRARFTRAAEEAKIKLSHEATARIEVENVPLTSQGTTNVLVNLSRSRLESLIEKLISRTLYLADQAIRTAGLTNRDLDAVVLVGGQTQMPYVRARLQKHFGQLVRHDIDPAKAVAMGAALLAQSVEQGMPAVNLEATLPITIGLSSPSNPVYKPFIKKNTPVPYRAAFPVSVPLAMWETFQHDVFQGDSPDVAENEYLGTLEVNTLEPGGVDPVPLTFEFELTKECLLQVYVTNATTGTRDEIMLQIKETAPSLEQLAKQS